MDIGIGINDLDESREGRGELLEFDRDMFPFGIGKPVAGFGESILDSGLGDSVLDTGLGDSVLITGLTISSLTTSDSADVLVFARDRSTRRCTWGESRLTGPLLSLDSIGTWGDVLLALDSPAEFESLLSIRSFCMMILDSVESIVSLSSRVGC